MEEWVFLTGGKRETERKLIKDDTPKEANPPLNSGGKKDGRRPRARWEKESEARGVDA